jgi:hypothetical protein
MGKIKDKLFEQDAHSDIDADISDAVGTSMSPPLVAAELAQLKDQIRMIEEGGNPERAGKSLLWIPLKSRRVLDHRVRADFSKLSRATDWVPFKATRKQQKKLLADESAEINDLLAAGRTVVARWRTCLVWLAWSRYLLTSPFGVLIRALAKTHIG